MKNLIIYLVLILFTNNIKQDPCYGIDPIPINPYYIVVKGIDGALLKVPNDIVKIDEKKYREWWCSEDFGNVIEEYIDGSAQTRKIKF